MLARLDIPVFLGSFYPDEIDHRLHLLQNPVDIRIDMQNNETKFALRAGFENDGTFTPHRLI